MNKQIPYKQFVNSVTRMAGCEIFFAQTNYAGKRSTRETIEVLDHDFPS